MTKLSPGMIMFLKATYQPGTRILCVHMDSTSDPIPDGTTGTVEYIDDNGTIQVMWDNHRDCPITFTRDVFKRAKGEY